MLQRRTPLKRTGGLKAKRAGPRTGRMKPNARFPDAKVKAYWSSLERRCVVCKSTQDTVLHHILARLPQKLRQRDHRFVAILCAAHHNMGDDSVHLLGSEAAFQHRHGVALVQIAVDNWGAFTNGCQSAPVFLAPSWRAFSIQCRAHEAHAGN